MKNELIKNICQTINCNNKTISTFCKNCIQNRISFSKIYEEFIYKIWHLDQQFENVNHVYNDQELDDLLQKLLKLNDIKKEIEKTRKLIALR